MAQLSLSHIINVSVSQTLSGLGPFNINAVMIGTSEAPGEAFASGYQFYRTASAVADDFGSGSKTAKMANALFAQSPNILAGGGYLVIATRAGSEDLITLIQRVQKLVQFHAIMCEFSQTDDQIKAAADYVQTQVMMLLVASNDATKATVTTGLFWKIMNAKDTQTRCFLYLKDDQEAADIALAGYCGRAFSTDFSGSRTTQTMHMKDLATIDVDINMTETIFTAAEVAGADMYASFQGVAKTFSTKANTFFDRVYNRNWFKSALIVAEFNILAQTQTKVPQTEEGMTTFKGGARQVCAQGVRNGFLAPGAWTSPDTFGNQQDFIRVIGEVGYYIYSTPVALQSAADREDRNAPLTQIAAKEAGAVHEGNILVNLNA